MDFVTLLGSPTSVPAIGHLVASVPEKGGLLECREEGGRTFLVAAGADKLATERAVLRLLGILDEEYPFCGAVPGGPMFSKAGLAGKPLLD